ncbi:uncharacterized protein PADG_00426 [Paracoccidioides brasiliensis Pb18]|uniref:Protein PNS1 n=1 Tax=Paracoccidioides brasiliensis (strain Pb18) TaxID=502780 RepID=C1G0N6_PARBD|nr:uncharacterized protein PADG_00426 [Paracoccidioides brasiliensis Pb18]EEH44137.1 hypothetical protein PADG_00426 [Paracoccidioides brasiliensis Pb18]
MSQPLAQDADPSRNPRGEQPRASKKKQKRAVLSMPSINISMGNFTLTLRKINLSRILSIFSGNKRNGGDGDGGGGDGDGDGDDDPQELTFKEGFRLYKSEYHDIWAGILFLLTLFGFISLSSTVIDRFEKGMDFKGHTINDPTNTIALDMNTFILFSVVLSTAFTASMAYYQIFLFFTNQLVWFTGIFNVGFGLGIGVVYMYRRQWGSGITHVTFGGLALVYFVSWIPRFPFTTLLLRTAATVTRRHVAVHLVSFIGGILATSFAAWLFVTLVAVYIAFQPNEMRSNLLCRDQECKAVITIALTSFITFASYWMTEWMKNTMHTAVAGVYGSWYFYGGNSNPMPSAPLRGALGRALTRSFGSICLGSLFVAPVDMLRQACTIIPRQEETVDQNTLEEVANRVLGVAMKFLGRITQSFNRYAFSHVALYGKPYSPAAKFTWQMMEHRGIDALVNDSVVGATISMGSLFVGYLCAFLAYIELGYTVPDFNRGETFTSAVMAYAFLSGFQICKIYMAPVTSGVDTTFMAIGLDPEILVTQHPDLWESLVAVYPRVQESIHA